MVKKRDRELTIVRRNLAQADISDDDRALLEEFDTGLERDDDKGASRHAEVMSYALTIARYRSLPTEKDIPIHGLSLREILESEDALEGLLDWLDRRRVVRNGREKPLADRTKTHYHGAVRSMGEILTDGEGRPPHIESLAAAVHDTTDPTPHPNTILYWDEHICKILDCGDVPVRDKAFCAVAWESGARPWELHDLDWGDLDVRDDYIVMAIEDGKTTDRNPRLVASMPHLKQWLDEHPIHEEADEGENIPPETPLWSHLQQPKRHKDLSRRTHFAGESAGVNRPTNLQQFRKSRASILAMSPEVTEQALRYRFGWKPESDAPKHYKATFGTEAEDQIAAADGVDIELADEHDDPAPVKCPNCENWTPRHQSKCLFCTAEFDIDAAEENSAAELVEDQKLREKQRELLALVGEGEISPETLRRVEGFASVLDDDPEMTDKAERFLESLEDTGD
jgi:integrase